MKNLLLAATLLSVGLWSSAVLARGGHGGGHGGGHHGGGHHGGGHHAGHHGGGHAGHHGGHAGHHANDNGNHNGHHNGHHGNFAHRNGFHNGNRNGWHNGWHNGYWGGGWGGSWGGWGGWPAAWGAAGLAGAYAYTNPYWTSGTTVANNSGLDYSQPLASTTSDNSQQYADNSSDSNSTDGSSTASSVATNDQPNTQQQASLAKLDSARAAFKQGDYAQAQQLSEQAISLMPDDPTLHEFRALTLFAQKQYDPAGAAMYAVLAAGPGWNEETVRALYADPVVYISQVQALAEFVQAHPNDAAARFLLAYHELTDGRQDAAITQLEQVVKLEPKDQLSVALLKSLQTPADAQQPADSEAAAG